MRKPIIDGEITYIPLTQGKMAIIDTSKLDLVDGVNWYFLPYSNTGYAGTRLTEEGKKKLIRMHRVIVDAPNGQEVDHINGDGLDNRVENLRLVNRHQNQRNSKKRRDNSSGLKGVYFDKKSGKWRAKIRVNGYQKSLGLFLSKDDAYDAYCSASKKYHGKFGRVE